MKTRNPIAKVVTHIRPKVMPDKRAEKMAQHLEKVEMASWAELNDVAELGYN